MIVLPILELNTNKSEQWDKIKEELEEVLAAMCDTSDKGRAETLQECLDVIEATINLMFQIGTKKEIEVAGARHYLKLKNRGHVFNGTIELTIR